MARCLPQSLDLIFEFEFFLLQSADLDVVCTWPRDRLIDPFLKDAVLFCEFCKMSRNCHHLPPKEIADVEIVPHVSSVVKRLHAHTHEI
jgi:hypothetical protein